MKQLDIRNRKIIDAVIEKANRVCPKSLALIGIYGSFATGDFCEKSDLDLLVLINDDNGWQLGCTFIQDDLEVGHDIYCTTWGSLQKDSLYESPNISKLMDSEIVYCADEQYLEKLEALRKKVNENLAAPFSKEDYGKAENMLKEAEHFYVLAMMAENMADLWVQAGYAVYYIENAIAMLNKKYFHYGTKRTYEELEAMEKRPSKLCEMIERVLSADSAERVKNYLTTLMQETIAIFKRAEETVRVPKEPATADSLRGTYEEMFSNWRNKMYVAAETNDRHLAFMSMVSLNAMISEVGDEAEIAGYDVLGGYDAQNLKRTAQAYDDTIKGYLEEYRKVGLQVRRYRDISAFVEGYLKW